MALLRTLLPLVAISVVTFVTDARTCTDYAHAVSDKNDNATHVMCATPASSCRLTKTGVALEDQHRILHAFNSHRDQLARGKLFSLPPASNMRQVVWDDELAAIAQAQANICNELAACPECRATNSFSVGQIVHMVKGSKEKLSWKQLVHRWFDKLRHLPPTVVDYYNPLLDNVSHVEVAWARANRIGCGFSTYRIKREQIQLFICNYGPGQLEPGQKLYTRGKPCGLQPRNSCCPTYSALICPSSTPHRRKTRDIDPNLAHSSEALPNWSEFPAFPELLTCTFNRDCRIKSIGTHPWSFKNTTEGEFYEVVLRRGGNAVLFILNGIPPSPTGTACLTFKYRKVTKGFAPVYLKVFSWSLMGPPIEIAIPEDALIWTESKTQISDLKGYAIVFFHVSVPNESAYSTLKVSVDDVKILAGDCS